MLYDLPWQFITKPEFRNTLGQTLYSVGDVFSASRSTVNIDPTTGLGELQKGSPLFDQWLRSGGAERGFSALSKNQHVEDLLSGRRTDPTFGQSAMNWAATPYHLLRWWGQSMTQIQRVGRYRAGLTAGESNIRAAVASSESAFHRGGFGGPMSKAMNTNTPFFLAYINSLNQTLKSQFGIGKTLTGERYSELPAGIPSIKFTAKALAVITLPTLYQWWENKDKEWYKAAPDWQKDNGIFLYNPFVENPEHIVFVKFPPLISFIYGGMPRRMMESYFNDNPKAKEGVSTSLAVSLLPSGGLLRYNVLLPLLENKINYSLFTGQPLVPQHVKENFAPYNQFNQYSSETAKGLSKFLADTPVLNGMKLSPPQIDNLIQGWFGTLGDAAIKVAELAMHKSGWSR